MTNRCVNGTDKVHCVQEGSEEGKEAKTKKTEKEGRKWN
jgi:hypothetical protein